MLVEDLRRGLPAETFAGSIVEGCGEVVGGPAGQIRALREVLAQQAVGVLIRAAPPRAVRVGEETRGAGLDLELGVRGQLPAVIHVSDRGMSWGEVLMVEVSAFFIVIAP